jgi:hypothetical protein
LAELGIVDAPDYTGYIIVLILGLIMLFRGANCVVVGLHGS